MVKSTLFPLIFLIFHLSACQKSRVDNAAQVGQKEKAGGILKLPSPQRSATCCLDSILSAMKATNPVVLRGSANKGFLQVIDMNQKYNFRSKEIQSWLDLIDKGRLKVYGISTQEFEFYIFSAPTAVATGLETNFTNWLLVTPQSIKTIDFQSLCDNPNTFYLDANRVLHYFSFDFNEHFIHEKDYENILFDIAENKIIESVESQIIFQKVSPCTCKSE